MHKRVNCTSKCSLLPDAIADKIFFSMFIVYLSISQIFLIYLRLRMDSSRPIKASCDIRATERCSKLHMASACLPAFHCAFWCRVLPR